MSQGSNTWARRMKKLHALSLAEYAVLDHIGWRDLHGLLTDTGIARDLGEHRTTVVRITRRLKAKGIIRQKGKAWFPAEMAAVVGEGVTPRVSGGEAAGEVTPRVSRRDTEGVRKMTPRVSRKSNREKKRKRASDFSARSAGDRPPLDSGGRQPSAASVISDGLPPVAKWSAFERSLVRRGEAVVIAGCVLPKASEAMAAAQAMLGNAETGSVAAH